jgi:hypothetical protein
VQTALRRKIMNTTPHLYRSEAFAEDLAGLVADTPRLLSERRLARLASWLPLGVALIGVAFAVVPPLG